MTSFGGSISKGLRSRIAMGKALACVWGLLLTLPVLAIADSVRFSIAAQPLPAALKAFAAQANMQLLYRFEAVESATANAVVGDFDKRAALEMLLDGTGLEAIYSKDNAATIRRTKNASTATPSNPTSSAAQSVAGTNGDVHLAQAEPPPPSPSLPSAQSQKVRSISDDSVDLGEVLVTGSRLRSGTQAGAVPVTVYDRVQLERLGITTAGELLRVIPQNQGTSATNPYNTLGGSRFPNLRGLGEGTTLVLINGQRPANSAVSLNGLATAAQFNLDAIPAAAIEQVEVLRDGASAIYGADAVGGVINVILRRGYSGVELAAKYSSATSADLAEQDYSAAAGMQLGRVSILVGGEYYDRGVFRGSERDYIAPLDKRPFGGTNLSFVGSAAPLPANVAAIPGSGNLPGLSSTVAASPGGNPRPLQISDFAATQGQSNGLADITNFLTVLTAQERASGFGQFDLAINDSWSTNLQALYSKSKTAANSETPFVNRVFGAANPYNPFGVNTLVSFYLVGSRAGGASVDVEDYSITAGIEGQFAEDWKLRANVLLGESRLDNFERATNFANLATALSASDPAAALNPLFNGQGNSQTLLDSLLTPSLEAHSNVRTRGASAGVTGAAFALPAGDIEVALGAEARNEELDVDSLNVNTAGRRVVNEDRDIGAAYMEVGVPLFQGEDSAGTWNLVDLTLAGRYEDYSDFGDTTNPKVGIRWRPARGLTFRGTWGTAFQAPSLSQLYTPPTVFSGTLFGTIFDPVLNQTYAVTTVIRSGNENLQPQEADTLSLGVAYEHALGQGFWNAAADFYRIDFTDRIRTPPTNQEMVNLSGLFPEFVVRDPATQRITTIIGQPVNMAAVDLTGVDFSLGYQLPLLGGTFETQLAGTVVDKYDLQVSPIAPVLDRRSFVGFSNRLKGNLQIQYSRPSWSAAATVFYADAYRSDVQLGREIRSQTTADLQLTYRCCGGVLGTLENLNVTVGVINIFDREPPFYNNFQGFDLGEGDPLQRRAYIKVSAAF